MSRTIEDRLAAALEARAELVTPQDLRPLEVPSASSRHVRAGVMLLAAAATAAAVVSPFVLDADGGTTPGPGPAGPPSAGVSESGAPEPSPSEPTESTAPSPPRDGVVADRQQADVDGDGRPDKVRVILDPLQDGMAAGFVEVTLASGGTSAAEVPFGYPPSLLPAFDINGDGQEQVLLSHTAGGDSAPLLVYTWHEGELVRARIDGEVRLALDLDGKGTLNHYYSNDQGFFSWRRLKPVSPGGWPMFTVEQWVWSVEGDRLEPTPARDACVDVTANEPPRPCTGQ